ncbi:hypothetical protein SDC9_79504 [bioreactor metagenome]|uniref:Uncharacterized protein n=1 Tax=bioreactor metagenome TaxID=1076179 RepID=A0A644YX35_9ZZZZ
MDLCLGGEMGISPDPDKNGSGIDQGSKNPGNDPRRKKPRYGLFGKKGENDKIDAGRNHVGEGARRCHTCRREGPVVLVPVHFRQDQLPENRRVREGRTGNGAEEGGAEAGGNGEGPRPPPRQLIQPVVYGLPETRHSRKGPHEDEEGNGAPVRAGDGMVHCLAEEGKGRVKAHEQQHSGETDQNKGQADGNAHSQGSEKGHNTDDAYRYGFHPLHSIRSSFCIPLFPGRRLHPIASHFLQERQAPGEKLEPEEHQPRHHDRLHGPQQHGLRSRNAGPGDEGRKGVPCPGVEKKGHYQKFNDGARQPEPRSHFRRKPRHDDLQPDMLVFFLAVGQPEINQYDHGKYGHLEQPLDRPVHLSRNDIHEKKHHHHRHQQSAEFGRHTVDFRQYLLHSHTPCQGAFPGENRAGKSANRFES